MFILRHRDVRKTVVVNGVGKIDLLSEQMIRVTDRDLADAFMEVSKFSLVSRPALPGEKPTHVFDKKKIVEEVVQDDVQEDEDEDDEEDKEDTNRGA